jgi:hypothetical protein
VNGLTLLDGLKDGAGVPVDALPLTKEDEEFNRVHNGENCLEPCGVRRALVPGAVVADTRLNRLLVFYNRTIQRESKESDRIGTSLAVWTPGSSILDHGTQTISPGMLFGPDEPAWGAAALVEKDRVYAYACETQGLGCSCRVARVPLASALDRSAWQFFVADGRWSSNWKDARAVLQGGITRGILSIHWNQFLGKFLAIWSRVLDSRIVIRFADRPEGPWSDTGTIEADTLSSGPGWSWTNTGLGHSELARDGGRIEYVTYRRNLGRLRETRLMEIRFGKK